jgi:hypothetical protein
MKNKVVVSVLGNQRSGKSHTWNALFGEPVRTGSHIRRLYLTPSEYVEVFLVSGSPEERRKYVGKIVGRKPPAIVLCSVQYLPSATQTIDYFLRRGYAFYTHWLNPGYSDDGRQQDALHLVAYLLDRGGLVAIRDATGNPGRRVREIKDFLYGWAKSRNLIGR